MSRIFFALAVVAELLLVVNIVIGLSIGDYNGLTRRLMKAMADDRARGTSADSRSPANRAASTKGDSPAEETDGGSSTEIDKPLPTTSDELASARAAFEPAHRRKTLHMLFGVFAGLVTLLVHAVAVTYFIGTSRWCREVVDAYQLDPTPAIESARLKRRTFPWALGGMLLMVLIAALGACSDPTGSVRNSADFVMLHRLIAILGAAGMAWAFLVQVGTIGANHLLIEQIVAEVRRIRRERGLDGDDEEGGMARAAS